MTSETFKDRKAVKTTGGFSMLELVVVMGVLAVLLSIAAPGLMHWMKGRELSDTARSIRTAIESVHTQAMAQGHVYAVGFETPATGPDRFLTMGLFALEDTSDNIFAKEHMLPESIRFQNPLPGSGVPAVAQDTGLSGLGGLIAFRTSGEIEPRYVSDAGTDPRIMLTGPGGRVKTITVNRVTGKVTVS